MWQEGEVRERARDRDQEGFTGSFLTTHKLLQVHILSMTTSIYIPFCKVSY